MATKPQLLALLAALEIPDNCGCPTAPLPCQCSRCKECRRKKPDRWQASDCEAGPTLPPACDHILDADHRVPCQVWASLLARYHGAEYATPPRPAKPTAARPGSAAKVEVMRQRLESGSHLYHPHDVRDLEGVGSVAHRTQNGREKELSEAISLGGCDGDDGDSGPGTDD